MSYEKTYLSLKNMNFITCVNFDWDRTVEVRENFRELLSLEGKYSKKAGNDAGLWD